MKNNFKIKILFIFFFFIFLNFQNLLANTLNFKAKNIQTINEKIIKASEDIEIITNNGIKITADYLEFDIEKFYKIENNVQIIDDQKKSAFFQIRLIMMKILIYLNQLVLPKSIMIISLI